MKQEKFIEKAISVHGHRYDYTLVNYVNSITKVKIICPVHGEFLQSPSVHNQGRGCYYCGRDTLNRKQSNTTKIFIEKAKIVHNDKYDYSKVNYINNKTKIKITCPVHGEFEQRPDNHLAGACCYNCALEISVIKMTFTKEQFIERAKEIHGDKYDYTNVKYINSNIKVNIFCPIHGEFLQSPSKHLNNQGCPVCKESKGEKEVAKILTEMNIEFERQKKFKDCKNTRPLPFDFYISSINIAIEFQGKQHYRVDGHFIKNKDELLFRKYLDKIKSDYCFTNNINLITIKHDEDIKAKLIESGVIK